MSSAVLLLAAVGANGLLTGASLDQSIKQLPARHRMGVLLFSKYSRAADLANGIAWYAILGTGTALLTLASAAIILLERPGVPVGTALWLAVVCTGLHSGATVRAAPTNFSQRASSNDEPGLTRIFDRFERWQTFRVICQAMAFSSVLVAAALTQAR